MFQTVSLFFEFEQTDPDNLEMWWGGVCREDGRGAEIM